MTATYNYYYCSNLSVCFLTSDHSGGDYFAMTGQYSLMNSLWKKGKEYFAFGRWGSIVSSP